MVQPSSFVERGTTLKNRFVNEDTGEGFKLYEGYVEDVIEHGENENGTYVCCSVVYEDGETVQDLYLYDSDYEDEDSDLCWSIVSKDSLLISWINGLARETVTLKKAMQSLPDSSVDESEESAYSSTYDVPDSKTGNVILEISRVVLNIVASGFFLAYTYKIATDLL